jgi:hypothetical protein
MKGNAVRGYGESNIAEEGSYKYEEVIFNGYKYDVDNERYDAITCYPNLKMESRRIFYSKLFNLMKSSYRY